MWSQNGLRLAYYSSGTGSMQLWNYVLAARAGRTVTSLPNGISPDPRIWLLVGAGALRYDWSPDSSKLVFVSRVPQNGGDVDNVESERPAARNYAPLILDSSTDADLTISGIF